jgi:hypothetical protein
VDVQQQQQLPGLSWAMNQAGMCSSVHLAASSRLRVVRPTPMADLQREWTAHLQAAAAAGTIAKDVSDNSICKCSSTPAGCGSDVVTVSKKQQQQQQQPGLQRLQQLLAANAAVPAGQLAGLRQLDLSLEQLLDLQGLGQLCPQLTVSDKHA